MIVLCIGKGEVCLYEDTLTDIIVKVHTCRETPHLIFNRCTRLMVETTGNTESRFLTTTIYCNVVVLAKSDLSNFLQPIRIIVVLVVLREIRIVVNLADIA